MPRLPPACLDVLQLTSYCFRFTLPSQAAVLLVLSLRTLRADRFTLVFDDISGCPSSSDGLSERLGDQMPLSPVRPTSVSAAHLEVSPSSSALAGQLIRDAPADVVPPRPLDRIGGPASDTHAKGDATVAKVLPSRPGLAFSAFVLRNYYSGVVLNLFSIKHTDKSACI